jgi:hypothetical protein
MVSPSFQTDLRVKAYGRAGTIYYEEQRRVLGLTWEMSGVPEYEILVNTFNLRSWVLPESVKYRAELSETPY